MSYTYKYQRPALTVDAIVLRKNINIEVLLIQRGQPPFENKWAFPGGFVDMEETVEYAVERELLEETGLTGIKLKQFYTFSALDRDPRHRTISVAFVGIAVSDIEPKAGDDAKNAKWFNVDNLPELAFDHKEIMEKVLKEKLII